MSDLPEMLKGIIALEYHETAQAAWLADEKKHEGHPHKEHTHPGEGGKKIDGEDSLPEQCTMGGSSCDDKCKGGEKRKAAFQPVVAGWSAPPALPLH